MYSSQTLATCFYGKRVCLSSHGVICVVSVQSSIVGSWSQPSCAAPSSSSGVIGLSGGQPMPSVMRADFAMPGAVAGMRARSGSPALGAGSSNAVFGAAANSPLVRPKSGSPGVRADSPSFARAVPSGPSFKGRSRSPSIVAGPLSLNRPVPSSPGLMPRTDTLRAISTSPSFRGTSPHMPMQGVLDASIPRAMPCLAVCSISCLQHKHAAHVHGWLCQYIAWLAEMQHCILLLSLSVVSSCMLTRLASQRM